MGFDKKVIQKNLGSQKYGSVTGEIYVLGTNVARTNVASTNITMTAGIGLRWSQEPTFKVLLKSIQ